MRYSNTRLIPIASYSPDAMDRLIALIQKAAQEPKVRRKTRPSKASVERRLENKHRRSEKKRLRGPVPGAGE